MAAMQDVDAEPAEAGAPRGQRGAVGQGRAAVHGRVQAAEQLQRQARADAAAAALLLWAQLHGGISETLAIWV